MMAYSLLETTRANGLNPQKYLEYLLEARPDKNMSDEELENMDPWSPKVHECCVNKSKSVEDPGITRISRAQHPITLCLLYIGVWDTSGWRMQ